MASFFDRPFFRPTRGFLAGLRSAPAQTLAGLLPGFGEATGTIGSVIGIDPATGQALPTIARMAALFGIPLGGLSALKLRQARLARAENRTLFTTVVPGGYEGSLSPEIIQALGGPDKTPFPVRIPPGAHGKLIGYPDIYRPFNPLAALIAAGPSASLEDLATVIGDTSGATVRAGFLGHVMDRVSALPRHQGDPSWTRFDALKWELGSFVSLLERGVHTPEMEALWDDLVERPHVLFSPDGTLSERGSRLADYMERLAKAVPDELSTYDASLKPGTRIAGVEVDPETGEVRVAFVHDAFTTPRPIPGEPGFDSAYLKRWLRWADWDGMIPRMVHNRLKALGLDFLTPEQVRIGLTWYWVAHDIAKEMRDVAQRIGATHITLRHTAAIVAVFSGTTEWGLNMQIAKAFVENNGNLPSEYSFVPAKTLEKAKKIWNMVDGDPVEPLGAGRKMKEYYTKEQNFALTIEDPNRVGTTVIDRHTLDELFGFSSGVAAKPVQDYQIFYQKAKIAAEIANRIQTLVDLGFPYERPLTESEMQAITWTPARDWKTDPGTLEKRVPAEGRTDLEEVLRRRREWGGNFVISDSVLSVLEGRQRPGVADMVANARRSRGDRPSRWALSEPELTQEREDLNAEYRKFAKEIADDAKGVLLPAKRSDEALERLKDRFDGTEKSAVRAAYLLGRVVAREGKAALADAEAANGPFGATLPPVVVDRSVLQAWKDFLDEAIGMDATDNLSQTMLYAFDVGVRQQLNPGKTWKTIVPQRHQTIGEVPVGGKPVFQYLEVVESDGSSSVFALERPSVRAALRGLRPARVRADQPEGDVSVRFLPAAPERVPDISALRSLLEERFPDITEMEVVAGPDATPDSPVRGGVSPENAPTEVPAVAAHAPGWHVVVEVPSGSPPPELPYMSVQLSPANVTRRRYPHVTVNWDAVPADVLSGPDSPLRTTHWTAISLDAPSVTKVVRKDGTVLYLRDVVRDADGNIVGKDRWNGRKSVRVARDDISAVRPVDDSKVRQRAITSVLKKKGIPFTVQEWTIGEASGKYVLFSGMPLDEVLDLARRNDQEWVLSPEGRWYVNGPQAGRVAPAVGELEVTPGVSDGYRFGDVTWLVPYGEQTVPASRAAKAPEVQMPVNRVMYWLGRYPSFREINKVKEMLDAWASDPSHRFRPSVTWYGHGSLAPFGTVQVWETHFADDAARLVVRTRRPLDETSVPAWVDPGRASSMVDPRPVPGPAVVPAGPGTSLVEGRVVVRHPEGALQVSSRGFKVGNETARTAVVIVDPDKPVQIVPVFEKGEVTYVPGTVVLKMTREGPTIFPVGAKDVVALDRAAGAVSALFGRVRVSSQVIT